MHHVVVVVARVTMATVSVVGGEQAPQAFVAAHTDALAAWVSSLANAPGVHAATTTYNDPGEGVLFVPATVANKTPVLPYIDENHIFLTAGHYVLRVVDDFAPLSSRHMAALMSNAARAVRALVPSRTPWSPSLSKAPDAMIQFGYMRRNRQTYLTLLVINRDDLAAQDAIAAARDNPEMTIAEFVTSGVAWRAQQLSDASCNVLAYLVGQAIGLWGVNDPAGGAGTVVMRGAKTCAIRETSTAVTDVEIAPNAAQMLIPKHQWSVCTITRARSVGGVESYAITRNMVSLGNGSGPMLIHRGPNGGYDIDKPPSNVYRTLGDYAQDLGGFVPIHTQSRACVNITPDGSIVPRTVISRMPEMSTSGDGGGESGRHRHHHRRRRANNGSDGGGNDEKGVEIHWPGDMPYHHDVVTDRGDRNVVMDAHLGLAVGSDRNLRYNANGDMWTREEFEPLGAIVSPPDLSDVTLAEMVDHARSAKSSTVHLPIAHKDYPLVLTNWKTVSTGRPPLPDNNAAAEHVTIDTDMVAKLLQHVQPQQRRM